MDKPNKEIREAIEKRRIKYFEVAEKIGVSSCYFSRLLQRELPDERKKEILKAIKSIEF
jgi:transcriptional regulator with XRE-family HTH domain